MAWMDTFGIPRFGIPRFGAMDIASSGVTKIGGLAVLLVAILRPAGTSELVAIDVASWDLFFIELTTLSFAPTTPRPPRRDLDRLRQHPDGTAHSNPYSGP